MRKIIDGLMSFWKNVGGKWSNFVNTHAQQTYRHWLINLKVIQMVWFIIVFI